MENYIDLKVSDGTEMAAYASFPANKAGKLPGIMVWQEAFGVNSHMRRVTDRFAKEGYAAVCPELFHRTAPKGFEGSYTDFETVRPHTSALTVPGLEADIRATYDWLTAQENVDRERIYCVGYCMGGRVSFMANSILPVRAAVSYYGGGTDTIADRASNLHGKQLFYWGGLDKHIKSENIHTVLKAMEAAGKDFINVKISYADHAFNCDERASYNKAASEEAWALTLAFLANN
ncbi:MAG: dienelactone hydrolase family protein [Bacteroidetes bacterium]|nr:dienelactone hydrolase family protein [Bacteroidota bacterium]